MDDKEPIIYPGTVKKLFYVLQHARFGDYVEFIDNKIMVLNSPYGCKLFDLAEFMSETTNEDIVEINKCLMEKGEEGKYYPDFFRDFWFDIEKVDGGKHNVNALLLWEENAIFAIGQEYPIERSCQKNRCGSADPRIEPPIIFFWFSEKEKRCLKFAVSTRELNTIYENSDPTFDFFDIRSTALYKAEDFVNCGSMIGVRRYYIDDLYARDRSRDYTFIQCSYYFDYEAKEVIAKQEYWYEDFSSYVGRGNYKSTEYPPSRFKIDPVRIKPNESTVNIDWGSLVYENHF